jgi:hypothetical protein
MSGIGPELPPPKIILKATHGSEMQITAMAKKLAPALMVPPL